MSQTFCDLDFQKGWYDAKSNIIDSTYEVAETRRQFRYEEGRLAFIEAANKNRVDDLEALFDWPFFIDGDDDSNLVINTLSTLFELNRTHEERVRQTLDSLCGFV